MTEYVVEWVERHITRVEADNIKDACDTAVQMNDTFDIVLGEIKATTYKKYRVSWIEHREREVYAMTEIEAFDAAEECGDCDNCEIVEVG